MSYTKLYEHIIFTPKHRISCISPDKEEQLFRYIWSIIRNKKCRLIQINAAINHIHILIDRHPTISTSELVAHIKRSSSLWLNENNMLPAFPGWSREYAAISVSPSSVETVRNYIRNQKKHHAIMSFEDEFRSLMPDEEVEFEYF